MERIFTRYLTDNILTTAEFNSYTNMNPAESLLHIMMNDKLSLQIQSGLKLFLANCHLRQRDGEGPWGQDQEMKQMWLSSWKCTCRIHDISFLHINKNLKKQKKKKMGRGQG